LFLEGGQFCVEAAGLVAFGAQQGVEFGDTGVVRGLDALKFGGLGLGSGDPGAGIGGFGLGGGTEALELCGRESRSTARASRSRVRELTALDWASMERRSP
jgi:hypothetical protein